METETETTGFLENLEATNYQPPPTDKQKHNNKNKKPVSINK